MSESLKVVNPPEVLAYGTRVNTRVDEMFTELNTLSQNCVDVDYEGTNAFAFKTEAGTKAVEFGKALALQINDLKTGIASATTAIAGSLGGSGDQPRPVRQRDRRSDTEGRRRHPGSGTHRPDRPDHVGQHSLQQPGYRHRRLERPPRQQQDGVDGRRQERHRGVRRRRGARPPRRRVRRLARASSSSSPSSVTPSSRPTGPT